MSSVEKIFDDEVVNEMISEMSKKWKSHRTKKDSLAKAFAFVKSEAFKGLPVEVRVLILKGAFYVNRTLPKAEGGELE